MNQPKTNVNNPASNNNASVETPVRVVLFMTMPASSDVPVPAATPASTLPLGPATFAERVLDSCARAGVREVDVVACDQPERLRELLGDGFRWAMKINWHLARDGATPYGLLRTLALPARGRVLVGHGHIWVDEAAVRSLLESDRVAVGVRQDVEWAGWASFDQRTMRSIGAFDDYAAVAARLVGRTASTHMLLAGGQVAWAGPAEELYRSQQMALRNGDASGVPATWIRHPWGAASPAAVIHPEARIEGPVLLGPGCSVGKRAEIGPGVVLSRDVLVADAAIVRDTLVLPNTHVGSALEVERAIVNGRQVQDLKWSVRASFHARDAMLTELVAGKASSANWTGRIAAALAALVTLPVFVVAALAQLGLAGRAPWKSSEAVTGRGEDSGTLTTTKVREAAGAGTLAALLGRWGGLLDIVQGRRRWFGIRARTPVQWYALRRDWQSLFAGAAIGLFRAPAWRDRAAPADSDAIDAADAYFVVSASWRDRWRAIVLAE